MKKTKLLMPILCSIGFGSTLVPMIAMTSCSCGNSDTTVVTFTEDEYKEQCYSKNVSHKAGKYKTTFAAPRNHFDDTFIITYFDSNNEEHVPNAIKSVKFIIDNEQKPMTVIGDESEPSGWRFDNSGKVIDWTQAHNIQLEWETNPACEGEYALLIGTVH